MNTKPFKGANVFMSRNLVPPELFDALHDALKLNGADLFLCCDPSRNSPSDFHVISSDLHEKFDDLRKKGCNLLGPQCVFSCAKERRALPRSGYVCCLAMDGVKVLTTGFETGERERIGKLVKAMSGSFATALSSDVSFVIAKNVTAAKYKWAASKEKHIVTINWLNQCWIEHRIVPLESYRVPPFLGLVISVSRIPADERKQIERLVKQNGGKYSAELTKSCTHLICEVPEGDKFKVAQRWSDTRIVSRKWFDQSIVKKVCLNEEAYAVQSGSVSSASMLRSKLVGKSGRGKYLKSSQSCMSSGATESSLQAAPSGGNMESEDFALSQNTSSANVSNVSAFVNEQEAGIPDQPENEKELEACIADDSETDDDDLYLSDCKICLVGFTSSDVRKLVSMVRKGGGSRYMSCSERLTHIVVGAPSENEKRELRGLAALGVIHIVKRNWLEDCVRLKKEVPVIQKHIAHGVLVFRDTGSLPCKSLGSGMSSIAQVEHGSKLCKAATSLTSEAEKLVTGMSVEKSREDIPGSININNCVAEEIKRSSQSEKLSSVKRKQTQQKRQISDKLQSGKLSKAFAGKLFCFSRTFPEHQMEEVVQWINEGGGEVVDSHRLMEVDFVVECHGVIPKLSSTSRSTYVSSHWIRSSLEDGRLLNVSSHILYAPLPCQVPLPGFKGMRFCVSQYTEKERSLLRNLCFTLGAKFGENLTKKVTHLLCKFANGHKYEAACKWGVQSVRCEWLYECVVKSEVVSLSNYFPEEVPQDPESGVCTVTQYPSQASRLISMDSSSQFSTQSQVLGKVTSEQPGKRVRLLELGGGPTKLRKDSSTLEFCKDAKKGGDNDPDVAAAIEDLLEQTSKIQDLIAPVGKSSPSEKTVTFVSSDCPVVSRDHTVPLSPFGPSTHWLRSLGKEQPQNASKNSRASIHDSFSETQTENQLVGYEEDLSGRQMIIDRVRTQNSLS